MTNTVSIFKIYGNNVLIGHKNNSNMKLKAKLLFLDYFNSKGGWQLQVS